MDQPPPLNLIRLGSEWIATNGELAADGTIRFPEDDSAEETFSGSRVPPPVDSSSSNPSTPPAKS